MDKKERALHLLESETDSISQSIYCSKECYKCPYLRRIRKMQGVVRIIMDYGHKPKNTTLQTFNDMKDKRTNKERTVRAGHNNLRSGKSRKGYVRDFFTGEWIKDVNEGA